MKKIFTLLAVAAMAFSAQAEITYLPVVCNTKEVAGVDDDGNPITKLEAVNFEADAVLFDNDVLKATLAYAGKAGIKAEYEYNLNAADEAATPEMTPVFTDWFEFRSKKPAEGVWPPEADGANRTPVMLEMKQTATIYAFVRTGNTKHIELYGSDCVEVTRTSEGYTVDPSSESNGFFVARWDNVPAGSYVITERGGTGRFSAIAYEIGSQSGIAGIEADENAPVEYFNLQGVRVANPGNGLYIRRQGSKVSKVIL